VGQVHRLQEVRTVTVRLQVQAQVTVLRQEVLQAVHTQAEVIRQEVALQEAVLQEADHQVEVLAVDQVTEDNHFRKNFIKNNKTNTKYCRYEKINIFT